MSLIKPFNGIRHQKEFVKKVPEAQVYYEFKSQKLKFIFPEPTMLDGIKTKGKPICRGQIGNKP